MHELKVCSLFHCMYLCINFSCRPFQQRESLPSYTRGSIRLVLYTLIWGRKRRNLQIGVQKGSSQKLKHKPSMDGDVFFLYFITLLQNSRYDKKQFSRYMYFYCAFSFSFSFFCKEIICFLRTVSIRKFAIRILCLANLMGIFKYYMYVVFGKLNQFHRVISFIASHVGMDEFDGWPLCSLINVAMKTRKGGIQIKYAIPSIHE